MRRSVAVTAVLAAFMLCASAEAQPVAGQAQGAQQQQQPQATATDWSNQPKEALEKERARRHAATEAAAQAARDKAFLLTAAAADGPGEAYDKAKRAYTFAYNGVRLAALDEAWLDPATMKAELAKKAAAAAARQASAHHPSDFAIEARAYEEDKKAGKARDEAEAKAVDAIMAGLVADGVLPPNSDSFQPKTSASGDGSGQPANKPPAKPEPDVPTRLEQPVLGPSPFHPPQPPKSEGSGGASQSSIPSGGTNASPSALEVAVVDEINFARTHPQDYAAKLGGQSGTLEAVGFLGQQKPLEPLQTDPPLTAAADKHAADIGPLGLVGHTGSDGSKPAERMRREGAWSMVFAEEISLSQTTAAGVVSQLIIDKTSPNRSHRKDLFDGNLKVVGVGCGPHKVYGSMCVIDMTGTPLAPPRPPPPPPPPPP